MTDGEFYAKVRTSFWVEGQKSKVGGGMAETEFKYDVFISYSHKDEEWADKVLTFNPE